jgi:hypothetical protein
VERMMNTSGFDDSLYFECWKRMFHSAEDDPVITEIQAQMLEKLNRLGKTPVDLLQNWVSATYDDLFERKSNGQLRLKGEEDYRNMDLEIVVAVPPGRSPEMHEQVRRAFAQRGVERKQVTLVSEPECTFRSWVHAGRDLVNWKPNSKYLM